jgi:hypothetical protein
MKSETKMFKKLMMVVVAVMMMAIMFSACGNSNPVAPEPTVESTPMCEIQGLTSSDFTISKISSTEYEINLTTPLSAYTLYYGYVTATSSVNISNLPINSDDPINLILYANNIPSAEITFLKSNGNIIIGRFEFSSADPITKINIKLYYNDINANVIYIPFVLSRISIF